MYCCNSWIPFSQKILVTKSSREVRMFAQSWHSFRCLCNQDGKFGITGHLPHEISRVTNFLLKRGAVTYAEITLAHYERSPIMLGGYKILCKVTIKLHGTVKNHMLLDRYMPLINSLYCEPNEVTMGSLLTKMQLPALLPASRIAASSVKNS